jgi:hypothetical protein
MELLCLRGIWQIASARLAEFREQLKAMRVRDVWQRGTSTRDLDVINLDVINLNVINLNVINLNVEHRDARAVRLELRGRAHRRKSSRARQSRHRAKHNLRLVDER